MTRRRYRAYGLTIVSDLALPELEPDAGSGPADLVIRRGETGRGAPRSFSDDRLEFGPDEQFFCWPQDGAFLIRGTGEIVVEASPGVDDAVLAFPLLGPVFGILLHLRGLLVLHASGVAKGGRAAVFMGDKTAGKSTLAAAFLREGYTLLTDDLLAIDVPRQGAPAILPAFPQIKLAKDAEAAITLEGAEKLPVADAAFAKRQQRVTGFSQDAALPSALFVLVRGESASAVRLGPAEALSAIVKFSYAGRFPMRPLAGEEAREHLRQCATLANAAPVYRLAVPQGLERLGDVVSAVETVLCAQAS